MFIGEYRHTIDEKNRLAVPAKFRGALADGVTVTRGLDRCLFVFTSSEWAILAQKLVALPLAQANSRAFSRLMLAGAMELELDSHGRILVPDYLKVYASLDKEVAVAGLYNRFEIWDAKRWDKYKQETESNSGDIAEKLAELGI